MGEERPRRKWEPREMRLCSEYCTTYHHKARILTRVRLGRYPSELLKYVSEEEELRMLTLWRRWADAIAIYPDRVVIVECTILPKPGKIQQLLLYKRLFYETPEFEDIKHLPVELELVYAVEDPHIVKLCEEYGIKAVYFKPRWIEEYLAQLYPRHRREPIQPI
jgi:hypothetical protein